MLDLYTKIAEWLCSWRADRWLHFVVSLIIAFAVAKIATATGFDKGGAVATAFAVCIVLGVAKECLDSQRDCAFDVWDLLFGVIGTAVGLAMYAV